MAYQPRKTDEFLANGLGAQYNTGLDSLLVVSMGTGTSFVKVQGSTVEHIGGLGIGGGTILGLSKLLLKTHDFHQIASLAEHGSLMISTFAYPGYYAASATRPAARRDSLYFWKSGCER